MSLIEFRGVKKAFGEKIVYRSLDLQIQKGESLTIIGGSGVGKSVMIKMLIGLLRPDGGDIFFDGQEISRFGEREFGPIRRRIAMLFQGAALFDSMNVYENVAYGVREHRKLGRGELDELVSQSLSYVGLEGSEEFWPADLSGGMKKRVGLARAIAMKPDVILYDEPTTGLDPVNVTRINELILHLQRTLSITSVVVTHDMSTVATVSDRVAMVHGGGIIFRGSQDDLHSSAVPEVRDFVQGNAPLDEDTETLLRSAG